LCKGKKMNNLVPVNNKAITAGAPVRAIIPQNLAEVMQIAEIIFASRLSPEGFKTPQAVAVAIMHGAEIGLTPMLSVQRIAVINGRPTLWGDGVPALVRGSGLCEYIEEYIDGDGDNRVAVCKSKWRGEPKETVRKFSVEDAKTAELWGTRNWKKFPERMLQMRARGFLTRDLYADVLGGMYLKEEIEDDDKKKDKEPIVDATYQEVKPKPVEKVADVVEAAPIPEPSKDLIDVAREKAMQGMPVYQQFYKEDLTKEEKLSLTTYGYHEANKEIAAQAEPQDDERLGE
jgi:hypothetical protein